MNKFITLFFLMALPLMAANVGFDTGTKLTSPTDLKYRGAEGNFNILRSTNAFIDSGLRTKSGQSAYTLASPTGSGTTNLIVNFTNNTVYVETLGFATTWITFTNIPSSSSIEETVILRLIGNGSRHVQILNTDFQFSTSISTNSLASGETEFYLQWTGTQKRLFQFPEPYLSTLTGNVQTQLDALTPWEEIAGIDYGVTLSTNNTYHGFVRTGYVAQSTNAIARWEAVHLNGSSQWGLADNDGVNTYPAWGLAVEAAATSAPVTVIVRGTVRNDAWSWTPGGTVYLSATAGGLTQTKPSALTSQIQEIGTALNADTLAVNPRAPVDLPGGITFSSTGVLTLNAGTIIVFGNRGTFDSPSDGNFQIRNNARTQTGTLLWNNLCTTKTSDYTVAADSESGTVFDNVGASGTVIITLRAAIRGERFTFAVAAAQILRITPVGDDSIQVAGVNGGAAASIDSNVIGDVIEITAVSSSLWVATRIVGAGW